MSQLTSSAPTFPDLLDCPFAAGDLGEQDVAVDEDDLPPFWD